MIIGLSGKKQVGKDTVGMYLRSYYSFKRKAFADLVKQTAAVAFNFKEEQLVDQDMKELLDHRFNITPREALQRIGVGMRQLFGEDFWVRRLQLDLLAKQENHNYVITDVRFPNEVSAIKNHGGVLIRIIRPNIQNGDNHISETALDEVPPEEYDYTLVNDGDTQQLYAKVDSIMCGLGFISND